MAETADYSRKIIHIDMDAFYASIEQRDNPELQGKPIAVGGGGLRGVVATASYEARKFGVHSAMSSFRAKQLCPHLIFVPARFDVYKSVSRQVRAIFETYTDLIEPLSLDEAYLDVTDNKKGIAFAMDIARQIMDEVSKRHDRPKEFEILRMILVDRKGNKENRLVRRYTREFADGLYRLNGPWIKLATA